MTICATTENRKWTHLCLGVLPVYLATHSENLGPVVHLWLSGSVRKRAECFVKLKHTNNTAVAGKPGLSRKVPQAVVVTLDEGVFRA